MDKTYDLSRFHITQHRDYSRALAEICSGRKIGHWIWYIFPQISGLGTSSMCMIYGLDGLGEAKAYLADAALRSHLLEITRALYEVEGREIDEIVDFPDDLKIRSCMTLFAEAAEVDDRQVFLDVLDKYYGGERDHETIRMLRERGDIA